MLSNIGAIAGARRGHENADRSFAGGRFVGGGGGRGGVHGGSSPGGVEVEEGPSTTATDDAKGEEILAGIRLLISVRVEVDPSANRSESENQPRVTDLLEYSTVSSRTYFQLGLGGSSLEGIHTHARKSLLEGILTLTLALVVWSWVLSWCCILMLPLMMDSFDVSFDDCL